MITTTTASTTTPANPLQFRTLTAKYAGICRRCNGKIAVGDTIRYGGKGKTYHLATDCALAVLRNPQRIADALTVPAAQAPQLQAQPAPTDHQIMSTAIAESLRQTFAGLMALPAKLGDVEPRVVEAAAPAAAAAEPDPEPVQAAPTVVAPVQAQKARPKRQTARRKANVALTMAQPLDPDDLF